VPLGFGHGEFTKGSLAPAEVAAPGNSLAEKGSGSDSGRGLRRRRYPKSRLQSTRCGQLESARADLQCAPMGGRFFLHRHLMRSLINQ
jgi:hypothetical protein